MGTVKPKETYLIMQTADVTTQEVKNQREGTHRGECHCKLLRFVTLSSMHLKASMNNKFTISVLSYLANFVPSEEKTKKIEM